MLMLEMVSSFLIDIAAPINVWGDYTLHNPPIIFTITASSNYVPQFPTDKTLSIIKIYVGSLSFNISSLCLAGAADSNPDKISICDIGAVSF